MTDYAVTDRAPSERAVRAEAKRDETEFLRMVRKQFDRVMASESINRKDAVEDLKFKNGEQWPASIRSDRTIQKRPCLTVNKMKTFVHQITNDQRQNRPAINVSPVGDKSDPHTAKMLKGLIRQIERQSNADVAYDTGFDNAVSNGWGYWRVLTEYEGEDSFDQVIRIGRIRNPFRVYLDPDHQEPDGSDAKWGFISDLITREEFKELYPDADPIAWEESGAGDEFKNWTTLTHVRIAEYFYFDMETRNLVYLANGHTGYEDELSEEIKSQISSDPSLVTKEREVQCKKVMWCKLTAKQILEENDWMGKWIPIVKCIGDEVDVEGKISLSGLIRDAKDPQRMYNYWVTSETEMVALAPKAPFIMEEGQIEGHEKRWQQANEKSYPYLLYKGVNLAGKPAPPPQRQQFAGPPQGIVQAKISAAQDIQATTGIRFDATLQERMYDESGRALRELKRTGDLGNFHYVDNLARSLRHTGHILIDLIPKVYDTTRVLTILREDDKEEQIKIDPNLAVPYQTRPNKITGKVEKLFNPKMGDYEVAVTIGPSYATKRAEAADSMLAFMKAVPKSGDLIGDLIAKNMDWPGSEEISTRLYAMLPPQLLGKNLGDLPPEAKGQIISLQQNLQQMTQQLQMVMKELNDRKVDQSQEQQRIQNEQEKINKDFEAKLTKVAADMEIKLAALQKQDGSKDFTVAMEKISRDFEAKIIKIVMDMEAKRLATESKLNQPVKKDAP